MKFEDLLSNICASVLVGIVLLVAILGLIYYIIATIKTDKLRQDHIKTLDEHDKSVILDYRNCFWTLKKKHKTNNETNKEHIEPKI